MSPGITRRDTIIPVGGAPKGRAARRREDVSEFLAFALAGERFALPLDSVREILRLGAVTEVPRSRPDVLGILSVRGRIITVLDLRRRLGMPSTEPSRVSRILLVEGAVEIMGLLVDEVYQVYRLQEDELELAAVVAGDLSEYVFGIGRPGSVDTELAKEEDIMILLDPEPLLRR